MTKKGHQKFQRMKIENFVGKRLNWENLLRSLKNVRKQGEMQHCLRGGWTPLMVRKHFLDKQPSRAQTRALSVMRSGEHGIESDPNQWQKLMQYMTRIVQNRGKEVGVSCVAKKLKCEGRQIAQAYQLSDDSFKRPSLLSPDHK